MNIYVVRHGQTEENLKGTYYGTLDCNLTELGVKQSKVLGERLKNIKFDKVYCSDLKRARETLKYINVINDVVIDERIRERNFGVFEGKTFKEIEKEFEEECIAWNENWKGFKPEGGESFIDSYLRVETFMENLKAETGENILICTHGGIVRAMYIYILGGNLDFYWRFNSRNADLSIIKNNQGYFYIDSIIPMEVV